MQRNLNQHGQRKPGRERERGQILVMFALFLAVLVLFVGLGVDLGFAYITQAQLAKAVDAAALAGMSNYYQGAGTATAIAKNTFTVNFAPNNKQPGYIQGTPTVQTSFSVDQNSNELFTVTALATMKTFFIGLAGLPTLNVSDSSTATRAHVIMTLVLDHSGSMDPGCDLSDADCSQGGTYLPSAVANFISVFEDNVDQAAMVSFGATAVTKCGDGNPLQVRHHNGGQQYHLDRGHVFAWRTEQCAGDQQQRRRPYEYKRHQSRRVLHGRYGEHDSKQLCLHWHHRTGVEFRRLPERCWVCRFLACVEHCEDVCGSGVPSLCKPQRRHLHRLPDMWNCRLHSFVPILGLSGTSPPFHRSQVLPTRRLLPLRS